MPTPENVAEDDVASLRTPDLIAGGLAWLARTQCEDGGWGDTPDSPSNLSTTLLVLSAMTLCDAADSPSLTRAKAYVEAKTGGRIAETVTAHYGKDRTFAVPILMNCALAGLVPWSAVPSLPFELAIVPHRLYRLLKLQVVSYALPALIAVGLVVHVKKGSRNPLRKIVTKAVLRKLARLQPSHGGFLDATPLTSFVAMSLAGAGRSETGPSIRLSRTAGSRTEKNGELAGASLSHLTASSEEEDGVLAKALGFIRQSVREDGCWPIDTDLSTWVTSSALNALHHTKAGRAQDWGDTLRWLRDRQTQAVHPFTQAAPGGWPWTDKEGGVPDGDDTSGAILGLCALEGPSDVTARGSQWLMDLQNADGGWPTFCKGWGKLPFDQSSPDITAHAIRALRASGPPGAKKAIARGLRYLEASRRPDGSWIPLWFGSQLTSDHANPVLGTSRALMAFGGEGGSGSAAHRPPEAALKFLLAAQNPDGSWGAVQGVPGTVEETALAVTALTHCDRFVDDQPELEAAWRKGAGRLAEWVEGGGLNSPAPIGLYFASLWYSERLYPVIWTVEALGRAVECFGRQRVATTD